MRKNGSSTKNWRWPVPVLDRAGQTAFWDRQSSTYQDADMTVDNAEELDLVAALCNDFSECGYTAEDVITLGGANGCRDPRVVVDALVSNGQHPHEVVFNDLSEKMTRAASRSSLARYRNAGMKVRTEHGPIHNATRRIQHKPRRVILGVYHATALTTACPERGYPLSGLEAYIQNSAVIGDRLIVESYEVTDGAYGPPIARKFLSEKTSWKQTDDCLNSLADWRSDEGAKVVRVIGTHAGTSGFFLSHWFSERAIRDLVSAHMKPRAREVTLTQSAKGYVLCIDSKKTPRGVVTVLNNVLGNILPHEQGLTLRAIDALSS